MKALLVALLCGALASCATVPDYIHMTDEEKVACKTAEAGCSVWTEEQLMGLAQYFFARGVNAGVQKQKGTI